MIPEAGHFALALALALSLVQLGVPLWGARVGDRLLMEIAPPAALAVFGLVALSFAALAAAHVGSDFSVLNVSENSHTAKPLIYKLTGIWASHEGSMLLWVLILTLFGALVATSRGLPARLKTHALAIQASIGVAFLLFILFSSNPFERLDPAPLQGRDLNPVLQDPGLAIHPPLLYLGYVGFSMTFALAMAALIDGRVDAVWAKAARPWVLLAWCFLTLGIAMGSYWAYYELGWGGFWFWDPVENASLMPWLAGTALLHSVVVMEKREALKVWTILLAILTFSLSLLGTFLVRSGVLTSVHAFAVDPARGVFILAILTVFIGGSLSIFAWRAPLLRQGGIFAPISREGALILNNLFLASACGTVLLGTLYPLALEALTGQKISVGAPYFNLTFLPLLVPLCLMVPFGQTLAWKRGDLLAGGQRLLLPFGAALALSLGLAAARSGGPVLAPAAIGLGAFLIFGSVADIAGRSHARARALSVTVRRAAGLPRSAWGSALAHAGLGVTVIGIAAQAWSTELVISLRPGESARIGSYDVQLVDIRPRPGPNFREDVARLAIREGGIVLAEVEAAKRFFATRSTTTTEAGIATLGLGQVYVSLGEIEAGGAAAGLRLYDKPLVLLIWLGAVAMAAGGALSFTDRRMRIGAPAKARTAASPAAVAGNEGGPRAPFGPDALARGRAGPGGPARRGPAGRAARGARARALGGAALPRLPEPVDRRFGRAAGARPAPSRPRTAPEGRCRPRGARLRRRALRRVRPAEARARLAHGRPMARAGVPGHRGGLRPRGSRPLPTSRALRAGRAAQPRGGGPPAAPRGRGCGGVSLTPLQRPYRHGRRQVAPSGTASHTKSSPDVPNGPQRQMRAADIQAPAQTPCRATASAA